MPKDWAGGEPDGATAATRRRDVLAVLVTGVALLGAGCADPTSVPPTTRIELVAADSVLVSDGVSTTRVEVKLPRSLPQDATIELATTLGRLLGPSGAPDRKIAMRAEQGRAAVLVIGSGETGIAYLSASGAGSSAQTTLRLAPAPAQRVELLVDRLAAPADGRAVVTATALLRRDRGAATGGAQVRFVATDSAGGLIPALSGTVFADSTGMARYPLTASQPGTVLIHAEVGSVRSDPLTVTFTPAAPTIAS
jgi:hypothetical protein